MKKGDHTDYISAEMGTRQTKPPARFTPATLLQGMKEIHKYVKDEAAKKMLRDVSGIGTEATRASIIEDLIVGNSPRRRQEEDPDADGGGIPPH